MFGTSRSHMGRQWLYVALVTLSHVCHPSWQVVRHSYFKVIKDSRLSDTTGDELTLPAGALGGPVGCASACSLRQTCTSATFDPVRRTCRQNQQDLYTFGRQNLTSASHFLYLGKVQQDIRQDDWTLVFRGQANNSVSMWAAFTNGSYRSDRDMVNMNPAFTSRYPDVRLPHFRSRWLDLWPSDNINQVKVQLYKDGNADVNMTFNGTGSNQTNWFSWSRLVSVSPYTDLTSSVLQFSLEKRTNRMFVISNTSQHSDCDQQAWLVVEDLESNRCFWSARTNWPSVLYSASTHQVNFNNRTEVYRLADILVVFVKFFQQP